MNMEMSSKNGDAIEDIEKLSTLEGEQFFYEVEIPKLQKLTTCTSMCECFEVELEVL
jgi:hypothetical protein